MNINEERTSVLVVGGSLVGSSMGAFLAKQGVDNIVVERHPGSALHPKATGFTPRTMEIFNTIDIAKDIPQAPSNFRLRRARVESLAGEWYEETEWTPGEESKDKVTYSPFNGAAIAQDKLEPLILNKARELGSDVRMNTQLVSFEQNDEGVTAILRNREDDQEYQVKADYLVAADGTHSPIREQLGIEREGQGYLRTMRSVLFNAPLDEYLESGVRQFDIDQEGLKAFLTSYGDGRWVLMFKDDIDRDENQLYRDIVKAIGRNDLYIHVITTGRWELSALIAKKFSVGRIFLAGDSAHTLPPTRGGFGANTGIQDAYNLAWKLAAVLSNQASKELLDTYDSERRPIANLRHDQTFARADYKVYIDGGYDIDIIDDDAMEFGELYHSNAVKGTNKSLPSALCIDQWAGQPGTRAPYLTYSSNNNELNTLDLFGNQYVVLTENKEWINVLEDIKRTTNLDFDYNQAGSSDFDIELTEFREAFGIGRTGITVVRPDGVIAWRSADQTQSPKEDLLAILQQITFQK